MNSSSSVLYLASQAMYFSSGFESADVITVKEVAVAQSVVYMVSMIVWLASAILYWKAWRIARVEPAWGGPNPPFFRDTYFYVEILNCVPRYVGGLIVVLFCSEGGYIVWAMLQLRSGDSL